MDKEYLFISIYVALMKVVPIPIVICRWKIQFVSQLERVTAIITIINIIDRQPRWLIGTSSKDKETSCNKVGRFLCTN